MNRVSYIAAVLLCACFLQSADAQTGSSEFNGRWESGILSGAPWSFDFTVSGSAVTGKAFQHGGQPGPVQIDDGRVDGDTITFKCTSPDGGKIIAFTGVRTGTDIVFTRQAQLLPDAPVPPPAGVLAETGLFGSEAIPRFSTRRVGPVPVAPAPPPAASQPVNLTGRWENLQWNGDVTTMNFTAAGGNVGGFMTATPGPGRQGAVNPGQNPMIEPTLTQDRISFKVLTGDGERMVTFDGRIAGNEIDFTRSVRVLKPRGNPGNNAVYGAYFPLTLVVRRAPDNPLPPTAIQNEISAAKAKWAARPFTKYEFAIAWDCLCPLPNVTMVFRVDAMKGEVDLASLPGQSGKKPDADKLASFDQIYDLLTAVAVRQPYQLKIEYDPQYGYPTSGQIDPSGIATDDDMRFKVTGFRVLD